jgi:predicted amidophosphoribosyltransferase
MGLLDSCLLCEGLLWKAGSFCVRCETGLLDFQLIRRQVGDLEVYSLLHYFGAAERLIQLCKAPDSHGLRRSLALKAVEKFALELIAPVVGVIPIPARRFGEHDHAYAVAECAASVFKAPLCNQFLERKSELPQKEKSLDERAQTKFAAREKIIETGAGVWILADDVITSGATLFEAWRALGEPAAVGLTLASTPRLRDFVFWP